MILRQSKTWPTWSAQTVRPVYFAIALRSAVEEEIDRNYTDALYMLGAR